MKMNLNMNVQSWEISPYTILAHTQIIFLFDPFPKQRLCQDAKVLEARAFDVGMF
jgi:hypothetical protein